MSAPFEWIVTAPPEARRKLVSRLSQSEKNSFAFIWPYAARPEQLPPPGDWRIWMTMAGRGFGKTRAGAEWVRMIADRNPDARIALVSSSLAEARAVMVEGESGLLSIYPPAARPRFEPSRRRIRFANGAQAQLFSAAEPESLRGPQHSHACRPGTKGILPQSVACYCGFAASPLGDSFAACTADECQRRRLLPDHCPCNTGVGRLRRPCHHSNWRQLALHCTARRHVHV